MWQIAIKMVVFACTCHLLGADPSAIDRHDNASLHVATLFGHLQLVKMLLKYDADVYQRGAKGAIPSHIAAREGHIHLIQVRILTDFTTGWLKTCRHFFTVRRVCIALTIYSCSCL